MITIKELKTMLNNLPLSMDSLPIILQKDAEGNGYSPLSSMQEAIYIPEHPWCGEVMDLKWTASDACMETKDWNKLKKDKKLRALIIQPIN